MITLGVISTSESMNYQEINRNTWNKKTKVHLESAFYDQAGFLKGKSSLNSIELKLLGDVRNKRILHLQCHFGQDTISLARMGAQVTGVDLADEAIDAAKKLACDCGVKATFVACDLYDAPKHIEEKFDIVFTSYGTIGWLPDLNRWAGIVQHFLKPSGQFIFAEFHPVVWMFDDDFKTVGYNYFNDGPIVETCTGTYADRDSDLISETVNWNHGIGEVLSALFAHGLYIEEFEEFDYSPYSCFKHTEEYEPGKFRIKHLANKLPLVYALKASKKTRP